MLSSYLKKLKLYFLLLLLISIPINALSSVDISKEEKIFLLQFSDFYLANKGLSLHEIVKQNHFEPYTQPNIHVAQSGKTAWIHFSLNNTSKEMIQKVLVLNSPSLESIALYRGVDSGPELQGIAYSTNHSTIYYTYTIKLPPNSTQEYYMQVYSDYTSFYFNLTLQEEELFRNEDNLKQAPRILILGLIFGLMLYVFMLGFYSRDKSYFYYGLYLLAILYQQVTFLGLTQIYFPHWFILFDMKIMIPKLGLVILTSVFFALSFLKIKRNSWLYKIYMLFFLLSLLMMSMLLNLSTVLIVGVLFILFNFIVGIIVYRKGEKQARLFIVGFGVVSIAYLVIISDSFGFTTILDSFPNILMCATTIEALLLTLAFADRYKILQEQKEEVDRNREQIIQDEVIEKTAQLNKALETKELLLKEIHHRVKNNLQIILSILRLQNDKITDKLVSEKFLNLENRINAIAKTYNMLLVDENLNSIDMEEYIESLVEDIEETMCLECDIEIETDIDATLPLSKSVYVGIIVNELVTNAYKYAFPNGMGKIYITLEKQNKEYILIIGDNGKGFVPNKESKSLGLKLIRALVKDQLGGKIEMMTQGATKYTIKFNE